MYWKWRSVADVVQWQVVRCLQDSREHPFKILTASESNITDSSIFDSRCVMMASNTIWLKLTICAYLIYSNSLMNHDSPLSSKSKLWSLGDIAPREGIPKAEKHRLERVISGSSNNLLDFYSRGQPKAANFIAPEWKKFEQNWPQIRTRTG